MLGNSDWQCTLGYQGQVQPARCLDKKQV